MWATEPRMESRQYIGMSCAVGWTTTCCTAPLSYRFSCCLYLHVRKRQQFYAKIRSVFGVRYGFSIPQLEPKNILRNIQLHEEKGEGLRSQTVKSTVRLLCRVPALVSVRVGTHARIFLRSLPRAQSVSLTH